MSLKQHVATEYLNLKIELSQVLKVHFQVHEQYGLVHWSQPVDTLLGHAVNLHNIFRRPSYQSATFPYNFFHRYAPDLSH